MPPLVAKNAHPASLFMQGAECHNLLWVTGAPAYKTAAKPVAAGVFVFILACRRAIGALADFVYQYDNSKGGKGINRHKANHSPAQAGLANFMQGAEWHDLSWVPGAPAYKTAARPAVAGVFVTVCLYLCLLYYLLLDIRKRPRAFARSRSPKIFQFKRRLCSIFCNCCCTFICNTKFSLKETALFDVALSR